MPLYMEIYYEKSTITLPYISEPLNFRYTWKSNDYGLAFLVLKLRLTNVPHQLDGKSENDPDTLKVTKCTLMIVHQRSTTHSLPSKVDVDRKIVRSISLPWPSYMDYPVFLLYPHIIM